MSNQIKIQLPDGSVREVPSGTSPLDIANSISPRLAAVVVVARIKPLEPVAATATEAALEASEEAMYSGHAAHAERVVDLTTPLTEDVTLELLKENDPAALRVVRHSAAHVMATALLELFPETKLGHGPATDSGFFYDVYREVPFTESDLAAIEARMAEVVARDEKFERVEETRDQALADYNKAGEFMKVHFIERFTKEGEAISLYKNGAFTDFCRGPHVPSTGRVKAFKLTSLAGAYWLGDEKNQQLQRLYGTAFFNTKDLDAHFKHLEEIKARDHRVLGKQLDLFSIQEVAGAGLIFWHPKGGLVRKAMEDWMREECIRRGYHMVFTPHIMRRELWKISGHEEVYAENMYPPMELDDAEYRLKPMNCPGHILIYKSTPKSYRDLPQRYAELGNVYRYERSGTMHGLLRVRGFTQDDAHVFCTRDQINSEIEACLDFAEAVLKTFGFKEYRVELSTHQPGNPDFIGTPEEWAQAESALHGVLTKRGLSFQTFPGEAAFYGPKIDVKLVDVLGRLWQLSTVQFDFKLPQRFDLEYTGEDGEKHQPVMVHRALFGSVERFFGVLIEHYAGAFPLWLAPVQVGLVPISEKHLQYAESVKARLEAAGLRVELDVSNNKMQGKIRDFGVQKVPFILIMGDKESATDQVSVRARGTGDEGSLPLEKFISRAQQLIQSHAMDLTQVKGRLFGPKARTYLSTNKWPHLDYYPDNETLALDLEAILSFAEESNTLRRYLPSLLSAENRDNALAELELGMFFSKHGFRIFDWHAKSPEGHTCDFMMQRAKEPKIFVEVKKLSSNSSYTIYNQLKSVSNLGSESPNLLIFVINLVKKSDDESSDWIHSIVDQSPIMSALSENLGGVAIIQPKVISGKHQYPLHYDYWAILNTSALTPLPISVENPVSTPHRSIPHGADSTEA